jgi:NADH-quinone oxidoreductase subunit G
MAQQIATATNGKFGFLGEAANSVGAYLAGAVPFGLTKESQAKQGMNAMQMLALPRKAYILLNAEPELDCANPQQAMAAMKAADMVVAMTAYKHLATVNSESGSLDAGLPPFGADYADVLLPIAPFTETSGTFVNTEGRAQSFKGAVKPLGEARPAWKVLRVLGNLLNLSGFDYDTSEAVRDEVLPSNNVVDKLDNRVAGVAIQAATANNQGLQRVTDVPIYFADAIVRRATALQKTRDALAPHAAIHSSELNKLGVKSGDTVKVSQGGASVRLRVHEDDRVPIHTVRISAGHPATAGLGAMFGVITIEPVSGVGA